MLDKDRIKLNAQLLAIEYVLANMIANHYRPYPNAREQLDIQRQNVRANFAQRTISGIDPALSDMAIGEVADALDDIFSLAKSVLKTG